MSETELTRIAVQRPVASLTVAEDIERTRRPSRHEEGDTSNSGQIAEQALAPVDGGLAAWRLLCAAFVFEALLWGFPLSFGVFQEYYSKTPEFADNRYISIVGTIASGFGYLGAPVIMPLVQRYQRCQRQMIWVGCVAYGVGFLIFYYPILSMVNEYWIARRGMAYGVLCGASGVSGTVMPFVLQALLAKYGYRITLRAVAVALTVLTGPFIPLLKGRLPPSERANIPRMKWDFFRRFGYFFPALYLPSYASSLRLGSKSGALLLALMSVFQVGGQLVFGFLSDRKVPLNVLACLSTVVAAVACFTMWRLAESLTVLIFFAIVYGFFAAGFTSIWARMSTAVTDDVTAGPIVFTLLNFGKGIGNVLAGPIGGLLISKPDLAAGAPSPSSYLWVIVFTGTCMFASTCVICLRSMRHLRLFMSW
ncbi:hypothetical protein KVR01_012173 [Diaporthe batatas]|uniref:uncharacterized protein n=1 Tax=Diaporthe batatas TaxID=748121 RepID=UPI001D0399F1|nr:uncharacterized protein KVR01_012173 [Diaporthe batatas]KAG8157901.1 hypothetical protein KVR01_012173 [Diaporthe batatas]